MKKSIFTVCFLLSSMMVMAQSINFKIKGQLPQTFNGEIFLVTNGDMGYVAIGNSIIKDGVFAIDGTVATAAVAFLVPKERNAIWGTLFLTEDAEFTVSTDATGILSVNGGGKDQGIYQEFEAVNKVLMNVKQQCELKAKTTTDVLQANALQNILNEAVVKAREKEVELITKHKESPITAYIISTNMQMVDNTILKQRYDLLGSGAKASLYGKMIAAQLAKLEKVAIGATAPDFSAPLADGGTIKLSEVKAKVKIVSFWGSWSVPCREENVNLVKLYKQFRPIGLEIISISLDDNKQTWLTAIGEDGSSWKNIMDLKDGKYEISSQYCVTSVPSIFILDEKNNIIAKNIKGEELKKIVEETLKKK